MKRLFASVIWFGLSATAALGQTPLGPGQLATRALPASPQAVLFNGNESYFVDVPGDAIRVVFELTSSPPGAEVDLFARLGQDVQQLATGDVLSDFASEDPGGAEQIEISADSTPALQPGRYFLAVRSQASPSTAFAFLRVTIELALPADVVLIARTDFERTEEGWQRNFPAPDPEVPGFTLGAETSTLATTRDSPQSSRFLELVSQGDDYFVVPRQFLGNLALLGPNARIEFDLRYRKELSFPAQEVEMKLFGSFSSFRWSAAKPDKDFMHYIAPLQAGSWQRISGSGNLETALANVLRIEIRANYGQTDGMTGLDNFSLYGEAPVPRVPVLSTFDSSAQGWTRNFPDAPYLQPRIFGATVGDQRTTIRNVGTDGNPGGYLQVTDAPDINQDYLLAPSTFLGDLAALGPDAAIEFDRRHASSFGAARPVEVRLIGFGGAYRFFGAPAATAWGRYRVPLTAANWTLIEGVQSFAETLRAIQRIEVSVDDVLGNEISGFDNFLLSGSPGAIPVLSANPAALSFVALQGGSQPEPQFTEITAQEGSTDWVAETSESWIVIETAEGITPGALVVRANPAGLARGTYTGTVEVTAAGASTALVVAVRLTVVSPTTPLISRGGVVNSATFLPNDQPGGELSGGMFVAIFGERLAIRIEQAAVVPFPTSLAGTSLTMGGVPMRLVYVSPEQIVAVTPQALTRPAGAAQNLTMADVVVTQNGESSPPETVRLKPVQPLIFTQNQTGSGLGAIQNVISGGVELNTFDRPARPGQVVTIFATGLGPTETPVPDGFAATGTNPITGAAEVSIGGINGAPQFAGLSPDSPHLYQVNTAVPTNSQTGCAVPVIVRVDGVPSNEVMLAVTADGSPCR